jgi:hypothetical protein
MLTKQMNGSIYSLLKRNGYDFNKPQKTYLHCLVTEYIYNERLEGRLLTDIEMQDLDPDYLSAVHLMFASEVERIDSIK